MEFTEVFEELREYARIIRNEKTTSANTALRIGDMYLSIIDAMEQVSQCCALFSLKEDSNGNQHIHTPYSIVSDKAVSAKGIGQSGGGGSVSYDRLDTWNSYTSDKAGYVLSAKLGWDLKTRLDNLDLGDFDLSGYYTAIEVNQLLSGKQDVISDLGTIRSGAALGATALQEHQVIYGLIVKGSNGTSLLSYTPNSKAAELILAKSHVGLGDVDNLAAKDYFTKLDSHATEGAIIVEIGGTKKTIAASALKDSLSLNLVENTKLSTWKGTSNITTVGTITSGTWNGTKIANAYLANSKITIAGNDVSLGGSVTAATLQDSLDIVTLSGSQTISGAKTFGALITANGGVTVPSTKTIKIGGGTISWDSTNNAFKFSHSVYSLGAMSAKGVGTSSGAGGGVDVDWLNFPSSIVPLSGYDLGSDSQPWGTLYVTRIENSQDDLYLDSGGYIRMLTDVVFGNNDNFSISPTGTAYLGNIYSNGNIVATLGDIDSKLSGYALKSEVYSGVISGETENGYYKISLSYGNGVGTNALIPSYSALGFTNIEQAEGYYLADQFLINDILDYVDNAVKNVNVNVDLSNYYTKTQVHTYVSQELNTFSEENLGTALQNYFPLSGNKTITGKVTISSAGFLEVQGNVYVGGALYSGLGNNNPYATQGWVKNQGYTSNIGTVTGVKINGSTKNPSSGIVDLGFVASYEAIADVVEDYLTYDYSLSSDTTDAVKLTTLLGRSQSITAATLKNSLGLKALAYKDSIDLSAYAKTSQLENYYTKDAADERYLKLSGGTLSGTLYLNYSLSNQAHIRFIDNRISGGGGYADDILAIYDSSSNNVGSLGLFGGSSGVLYYYLGHNNYDGNNLRVYADKVTFGDNTLIHSGNIGNYALPLSGGEIQGSLGVTGSISAQGIGTFANGLKVGGNDVIHSGNIGSQGVSYATSAGDASTLGGYSVNDYDRGKLFSSKTTIAGASSGYWYAKVVFNVQLNSRIQTIVCIPRYNNINGNLTIEVGSYASREGYIAKYSKYNTPSNIVGFAYNQEVIDGKYLSVLYLKLRGHANANVGVQSTMGILYSATGMVSETDVANISFVEVESQNIYTNYKINGEITNADKLSTARTIWGQSFDGSGNVSGNLLLGKALLLGYNGKGLIEAGETSYAIGYGYRENPLSLWASTFKMWANSATALFINSSGNTTLGSNNDLATTSYKLYVNGNSYVNGSITCKSTYIAGDIARFSRSGYTGISFQGISETEMRIMATDKNGSWSANNFRVFSDGRVYLGGKNATTLYVKEDSIEANKGINIYGALTGYVSGTDSDTWSITGQGAASFASLKVGGAVAATQTWVQNQGYATQTSVNNSLGSLSAEISAVDARIDALGTAAKKNWSGASSADTTNLVTIGWVESKLGGYATAASIPTKTSQLTNDSNFVSGHIETTVTGGGTGLVTGGAVYSFVEGSLSGYAKKATTLSGYGITDALPKSNPSVTGTLTVAGNVLPSNNNGTYSLGSANYRWSKLYTNGVDCTGTISSTTNISAQGNVTAINGGLSGKTLSVSGAASVSSLTVGGAVHSNLNIGGYRIKTEGGDIYGVYDGLDKLLYFDASAAFCSAFVQTSDERLKNILNGDFRLSLGTMACAPLVQFDWKNKPNSKHHIGTIAQYWDSCLPEVVSRTKNDTLALSYGELGVAMGISLAKEMIEMLTRVDNTESEIDKLKKRISELEKEIENLKA